MNVHLLLMSMDKYIFVCDCTNRGKYLVAEEERKINTKRVREVTAQSLSKQLCSNYFLVSILTVACLIKSDVNFDVGQGILKFNQGNGSFVEHPD